MVAEKDAQLAVLKMMLDKCVDGFIWDFGADGAICLTAKNEDTGRFDDLEFDTAEDALKYFYDMNWLVKTPSLAERLDTEGFKPPPDREDIALKIGESK